MPAQPIPGSNASPGTLATVLTAKYADGMPLYASTRPIVLFEYQPGREHEHPERFLKGMRVPS